MTDTGGSTVPKPYVFVLMPFASEFADAYRFGIKETADKIGAYAERLDEQIFSEGMLERIFNQISKADVIVADMTGRNPNVFYEVGYAHALGKIVLLLTQNADDVPFDLKQRQHINYAGSIQKLQQELAPRLLWAISESRRQARPLGAERFSVRMHGLDIPRCGTGADQPVISGVAPGRMVSLVALIRNESSSETLTITHVYWFAGDGAGLVPSTYAVYSGSAQGEFSWYTGSGPRLFNSSFDTPIEPFQANSVDAPDGLSSQYRLPLGFSNLPPGAVEAMRIDLMFNAGVDDVRAPFRLRLHTASQYYDYAFRLEIKLADDTDQQKKANEGKAASGPVPP